MSNTRNGEEQSCDSVEPRFYVGTLDWASGTESVENPPSRAGVSMSVATFSSPQIATWFEGNRFEKAALSRISRRIRNLLCW